MDPTDLINYAAALRSIESSGNYGAIGPRTRSGDQAYGAYQVMGNNIPSWTQKHYGKALTPKQFLQDEKAQDAVFNGEFGGYVQQYGNPQDAASMWFSGRPLANNNRSDGYLAVPEYVQRFNKALGAQGGDALSAINAQAGISDPQGGGGGGGALAFAGNDGTQTAPPNADQASSSGGVLFQSEEPNKLHTVGAMLANIGSSLASINNPAQSAQLRALAQNIAQNAHGDFQYMQGANGQLIRIDRRNNKVDSISIPGAQQGHWVAVGKDENGNPTGTLNSKTNEYRPFGAANPAVTVGGDPNLTGQERYNTLSPDEKRLIDAWHEGTGINPSQYSLRHGAGKMNRMMDAALAVYPDMDFQKYGERQQLLRGYANKNPSHLGGQLVSVEHTAALVGQQADRYLKMDNASGGPGGYGQTVANMAKTAMGGNARAAILNEAKGAAETLSGEYQTMIQRGKGGTGVERQEYAGNVYKPNAAPEVQAAGLQVMLDGLKARYTQLVEGVTSAGGESWVKKHKDIGAIQDTIDKVQTKIEQLREKGAGKGQPIGAVPSPAPTLGAGWSYLGSK